MDFHQLTKTLPENKPGICKATHCQNWLNFEFIYLSECEQSFFIFINEISFELRMEETSVLIIVEVMLCYLSSSERKA